MKSAAEKLFAFLNCCVCLSRVTNIDLLVFQNVFSISITYPLLNKGMTQSFLSDDKKIPTYLHTYFPPTYQPPSLKERSKRLVTCETFDQAITYGSDSPYFGQNSRPRESDPYV